VARFGVVYVLPIWRNILIPVSASDRYSCIIAFESTTVLRCQIRSF